VTKWWSWLSVSLLLASCATASGAQRVPQHHAEPSLDDADDSLLARSVQALSRAVTADGYERHVPIERGFLAPSARALRPVALAANTCVALVAVATPSIVDLDASLYASDGTVLAEDDASDARPIVRFCTGPEAMAAYLSLYAFQGAGTFALAHLTRAASTTDARWGATPHDSASPAFVDMVRTLRGRGYQDEGPETDLSLLPDMPLRISNNVAAGQCYSAVADGEYLSMRLLDDEGNQVAIGIGGREPAALQYCAPRTASFSLEVSTQRGARHAHLLRLRAAQTAVGGVRTGWLGEPSAVSTRLTTIVAAKIETCSGPTKRAQKVPLMQGQLFEQSLERLATERCELIETQLHEGLVHAELRVESANGDVLAQGDIRSAKSGVRVCNVPPGVRVVLVGRAGFGAITLERRVCED
jgi:hypothetical protein